MKRLLSILLVLLVGLGLILPTVASGSKSYRERIKVIDEYAIRDYEENAATRPEQTRPGDEIIIPIQPFGLRDEHDEIITDWHPTETDMGPTVSQLRSSRVTADFRVIKGDNVIRDVDIIEYKPTPRNRTRSAIRIRFVDDVDSSKEITYEFTVYLALDRQVTGATETFGGMIRNEILWADNLKYAFIGDGQLIEATGPNPGLELDIGNGVSIFRDMYKGDRFFGRSEIWGNDDQDKITSAYKEIETVYEIITIDVKFTGTPVKLNNEVDTRTPYYVYNVMGEFVGTSNENLPYSSRYYLSKTEINIDPSLAEPQYIDSDTVKMGAALARFVTGLEDDTVGYVITVPSEEEPAQLVEPALPGDTTGTTTTVPSTTTPEASIATQQPTGDVAQTPDASASTSSSQNQEDDYVGFGANS